MFTSVEIFKPGWELNKIVMSYAGHRTFQQQQAFREILVSPALISNLNVHKNMGLSHVKCKILTYLCYVIHLFTLVSREVSMKQKIGSVNEI